MARIMIVLDRDEIQKLLPYSLICMTREGAVWNTMHRKRQWKNEFTESERDSATRIFRMAHSWMLVKGVPDEVTMTTATYSLWIKIGKFCLSI